VIFVALTGASLTAFPQSSPAAAASTSSRALVDQYCVACHNDRLKTGNLSLEKIDTSRVGDSADVWEKVLQKVKTGAMPPVGRPRPDRTTAESFTSWLETSLDTAAAARPNPGRPAIHRLNRAEYANAVRDVLGVRIDSAALLPADSSGYGFD